MGKIVIYKKNDEFHWKLIARNGRVIAYSGEGYKTKWGAVRSIGNLSKYANSPIIDET